MTMATKKKLTRKQMIDIIVNNMNNWDPDEVLEWAKDHMCLILNECSKAQLEREYEDQCVPF